MQYLGLDTQALTCDKPTVKTHGMTWLLSETGQSLLEAGHKQLPQKAAINIERQVPRAHKKK